MFTSPSLVEIAKEQNCSVEQVILSWNLQRNVAFIPKSVRSERMLDNFGALKSSLERLTSKTDCKFRFKVLANS